MRRTRTINAAPARTASATVQTLADLIASSLASSNIETARIDAALEAARPALLMLTSGRHLKDSPVVLVAADTIGEFYCRYDAAAVDGEENLNPLPGMSAADAFTIHLPAPGLLTDTIAGLVAAHGDLTVEPAPTQVKQYDTFTAAAAAEPLDLASLKDLL